MSREKSFLYDYKRYKINPSSVPTLEGLMVEVENVHE
jgi:hypothetical protein